MAEHPPPVTRREWTDADFDILSWHDCYIHALALPGAPSHELALDLDFIVEWVPAVDPCFQGVTELALALDGPGGVHIDRIEREPRPRDPAWPAWQPSPRWTIHAHGGRIGFVASGFAQYLRAAPSLIEAPGAMSLDLGQRGGISFARGHTEK